MENKFYVRLNTIEKVKNFVAIVSKIDIDIDLIVDRYVIDAKSIMGIFSVDLTRNLLVKPHTDDRHEYEDIKEKVREFII
jgi:phosphotransferase system HPr-like phosphotransfer protein